jgi:hypothetical protein
MSTTTPIPDGPLSTSYFGTMPDIPSIRQTSTASWPTVNGTIPRPTVTQLNKIYFNKKILKETVERYNPNTLQHETAQVWEIPFSVDVEIPVGDLIQRIQRVMTDRGTYKNWDINMNTFLITASQVTSEWDTIP